MSHTITFTSNNDRDHDLPAKWAICDNCDGEGKCDNIGVITSSEWEMDWEDDERDHYMRGDYDVTCPTCKGDGKVLTVDRDACERSHRLTVLLHHYDKQQDAWESHERERASERRMGA